MSSFNKISVVFFACIAAGCISASAQWMPCAGTTGLNVRCLAAKDSILFAGTDTGIFFSSDTGATWTWRSNGLTADTVLSLFIDSSIVFAGTKGGGIFRSADNGLNWQAVNTGLSDSLIFCLNGIGGKIFAGAEAGKIYSSADGGFSWLLLNSGIFSGTAVNALAVGGTEILAAHDWGIDMSADSGTNWLSTGITVTNFLSLAVHDSEIYAGAGGDGVFYTTDNFVSWAMNSNGMTNTIIVSMAASDSAVFAAPLGSGVYASSDHSTNWYAFNIGLGDLNVNAVAVAGGYIFAGTASSGAWRRALNEVTAVEENIFFDSGAVSIYPNPATSVLHVKGLSGKTLIEIIDLTGKVLLSEEAAGNISIDLSTLEKGIYIFSAGSVMRKMVKV